MDGQRDGQRVVLAHDASKGVRVNCVRLVLDKFSLKPGDMLTFLSVVHQILHPSMFLVLIPRVCKRAGLEHD